MLKIRLNLRKVVAIAICLAVSVTMFAQDIITLKDGTDIQASVLEISEVDVNFKKFDNLDGPTYQLAKSEIFMIKYANGSKDVFTKPGKILSPVTQQFSTNSVSTNAQYKLGANLGLQWPIDEIDDILEYIFYGGGISGEYLITPNIGIGLSAGLYKLRGATLSPVTLTYKHYFLTENIQPYAGADVGCYIVSGAGFTETYFGLAQTVGSQFKLSDTLALDVNVKYSTMFDIGYDYFGVLGFNVGFVYSFGK